MEISTTRLLCYLVANVIFVLVQSETPLKICLRHAGCYIGRTMVTTNDLEFEAYLGIPYANPPLRFELPRQYFSEEDHDAKRAKCNCKQKNYLAHHRPITGSEDCLYLNVYRSSRRFRHEIPVLVFFHGGGFFSGSANPLFNGPEYIMDGHDVVLITVSYRLGPFGFLGTKDNAIPGNIGLKDQVAALYWVRRNVERFGGDKFRVTLLGHGAGGISVHLHTFSGISKGLFDSIISISGVANSIFAIDENPDQTARLTAKYCNISNWDKMNTRKLHRSLLYMDADALLNAGDKLKFWDIDSLINYRPVVEEDRIYSFLIRHPSWYLRNGEYWPVPTLLGRVEHEGGIRAVAIMENEDLRNDFNSKFLDIVVKMLELPSKFNEKQKIERTKIVLNEYKLENHTLNGNTVMDFMRLITDRVFNYPMYITIKNHVANVNLNKYPIYFYVFNCTTDHSYAETYAGHPIKRDYGIIHQDDQIYLFRKQFLFPDFHNKSMESKIHRIYVSLLGHFIKYGHHHLGLAFTPCNSSNFFPASGQICDYIELFSDKKIYNFIVSKEWDTTKMKLWDDILS